MARIDTSELIGPALNWAVGMADKRAIKIGWSKEKKAPLLDEGTHLTLYAPSTNPLEGQPIIEANLLQTGILDSCVPIWFGKVHCDGDLYESEGPTALIAAMRVYVASTLGMVVDVPPELLPPA